MSCGVTEGGSVIKALQNITYNLSEGDSSNTSQEEAVGGAAAERYSHSQVANLGGSSL